MAVCLYFTGCDRAAKSENVRDIKNGASASADHVPYLLSHLDHNRDHPTSETSRFSSW